MPTKERIARASLRLFSKKGFKGTTIKDIASEVGITEGAIYRHFRSKEDIIDYLLDRITGEIRDLLERDVFPYKDPKTQIGRLVEFLIRYAFENPDSFRFLTVYHILRENGHDSRLPGGMLIRMFREAYEQGKLKITPEVALSLIVGTIERLFILWELKILKIPREELIREVKGVVTKALF